MKAIIYAGVALFGIAATYGVDDYYKTNTKNAINKMYEEQEEVLDEYEATSEENKITPAVYKDATKKEDAIKLTPTNTKKIKRKKYERKIELENYSRGKIIEFVPPKVIESEITTPVTIKEKTTPAADAEPITVKEENKIEEVQVEKTRRLSLKKFSRAAPVRLKKVVSKEEE